MRKLAKTGAAPVKRTAAKPSAKRAAAKPYAKMAAAKPSAKMAAAKPSAKRAAPKPAAKKAPSSISKSSEPGFAQRADGIHLPTEYVNEIVPASKLQQGLQAAQGQIKQSLHDLAALFTQDFEVSEIEITLSFSATGQFLGFGAGGALSVKVKIVPS